MKMPRGFRLSQNYRGSGKNKGKTQGIADNQIICEDYNSYRLYFQGILVRHGMDTTFDRPASN